MPAPAGTDALPCLGSNICIGQLQISLPDRKENDPAVPVARSAYKTEFCLKTNIEIAVERYGIGHLAFFTVTFAKPVYCPKVAQKRLHSLITNVIRRRYGDRYIAVFERHASDAIHFHFVIYVPKDIRSGFDWSLAEMAYEAQKERDFVRAGKLWREAADKAENGDFLRGEWAFWRGLNRRYRWLGRCEMLPIRSTAEAVARYTGGYIAKHMQHRRPEDKGINLVRYGKGMHWARSRMAFNSPMCQLWRLRLKEFAHQVGCGSMDALKKKFGAKWAFRCAPAIQAIPLLVRLAGGIIDAGKFIPRDAVKLCCTLPRAGGRNYRLGRVSLPPDAQARHEAKVRILSMVRAVFGESAAVV